MFDEPIALTAESFQHAWLKVTRLLSESQWERRNLVVQTRNPTTLDDRFHDAVAGFALSQGLLSPKHIAYTLFPHGLYKNECNAEALFQAYNRKRGLYERLQQKKPGWGTYFRRMTHYEGSDGPVNQLERIILAIRTRDKINKAALTLVIQHPGAETVRPRGGPCLNYLAVQVEGGRTPTVGLLAVYRNHDFLARAYGNYWGLCNLLVFLAKEVGACPGPMTCVSSHAYVPGNKTALRTLVTNI